MSKVKYRSFRKSEETLWRSSLPENEVEKPINWSNTPEGYYYIRGNKQGHYKDYIYIDNKWYLLLLFLLIIVLIGYIMFKASIWLGVGYIMILIAIIIYLLYKQIEKY